MHLMRLGTRGNEIPVVVQGESSYDASSISRDFDGAFLASGGIDRLRDALAGGRLPQLDTTGLRVGAPIARPGAVICIGMNYAAHAEESGAKPPEVPVVFYKGSNTVVGPYDDVLIPRGGLKTDWEVELAIVIGSTTRYLDSPDQSRDHIAGFAISNDVSERAFQLEVSGGQWSKGKSCETFNPLGPWLVPVDEVDYQSLSLRSWVNGDERQDSSTADMIFGVDYLVWHLSQFMVLEPGDIVNTGTPQGVALSGRFPYLVAGDVMALEIEGLGRQEQRCVQA